MDNLLFYPTLTEELIESSGIKTDKYDFSYCYQNNYFPLMQKGSSVIKLSDPHEIWKIDTEGIILKKVVNIPYPELLYGTNGIACKDALIGICIIWTNKTLSQTGCILPESDIFSETGRSCSFTHSFLPGEIKGDLELSIVLYIKKSAQEVFPGEEILMNEVGVTIGKVETVVLDFNSIYMEFPIEEYKTPDAPLWWVEFSHWEDPKVDLFAKENLCLYLNPFYPACPMSGDEIVNFDLLVEILATTYMMIFNKIDENPGDLKATQQNLGLENNSICSIMHQFIESCQEPLHWENQQLLQKSLQTNIRKLLQEGDD